MEIKVRSILQQALDDLNTLASAKEDEEIYIEQMKAKAQALLNYIADLQRKEYNNSKAIEYVEKSKLNQLDTYCKYLYIDFDTEKIEHLDELLNILKGE